MEPYIIEINENCDIFDSTDLVDCSFAEVFSKPDHLILIMEDQMFEGDFVAAGMDRLELNNVREHNNPNKLRGIYYFYKNEILRIHRVKSKSNAVVPVGPQIKSCPAEIKLCEEEYERHQEMYRKYIFVDRRDHEYDETLQQLSEMQSLGVAALGVGESRSLGIGLLVLSTWETVYIFDLTTLKTDDLLPVKQIFENESVCKIFHRGGPQIDILSRNYNMSLINTFDIETVDLIIEKNKANGVPLQNTRNISECLNAYFNFPASFLSEALSTKNFKWFKRPLSDRRKMYAAQLATYLILLKEKMEKLMFSEVDAAVYNASDYYCNLDDFTKDLTTKEFSKETEKFRNKCIPILSRHGIDADRDKAESDAFLEENLKGVQDDVDGDLKLQADLESLKLAQRIKFNERFDAVKKEQEEHMFKQFLKKESKEEKIIKFNKRFDAVKKEQKEHMFKQFINKERIMTDEDNRREIRENKLKKKKEAYLKLFETCDDFTI